MRKIRVILLIAMLISSFIVPSPMSVQAATLPSGFQESIVFSGLTYPTNVRFSPDGRVFVAEKTGMIKVFDNLTDTTPTLFADLNINTHNFWDRGLLGLALDPNFPTNPYIYVLYTYDAAIGGTAPRWGTPGNGIWDDCPTPPGATTDGCVVSGRLSRLQANGNVMTGSEQVLIEAWCQQFPSHSIGDLVFGPDGALYVSGGDGASFNNVDYGQYGGQYAGDLRNPCGDPPGGVGGLMTAPSAEGGTLRSQSLRRPAGQPILLNGTILRVDPATGLGLPNNPLASNPDINARRIIAYGLRNPFRMTTRPGTNEIWLGDVGWSDWEEIDRITNPTDSVVENFGWPCYEGNVRQFAYDAADLTICENLYAEGSGAITPPYHLYHHANKVVPTDNCPTGSSSTAGLTFQFGSGNSYPPAYNGALFFADYTRDCIWVMFQGGNGQPNPSNISPFVEGASNPVDLEMGPDGNLYYADFDGGTIRRIEYFGQNQPPEAIASATPVNGTAPLTVNFDGSASHDPDIGNTITFAWDLDGDGAYDDSTAINPTFTYSQGIYTVRLQVTDNNGASDISDPITITSGNAPPTPVINTPPAGTTWKVGDVINFSGSATDLEDGTLPASAFTWTLIMHHCPSNCHEHTIQIFDGITSGSFTAPDHEYPSYLELRLTVTDSGGLTGSTSLQLDPQTVALTFQSNPGGLQISVDGATNTASFNVTVIVGSSNTITAASPQIKGKSTYYFQSWSDGGTQTHTIIAPASATTYTAKFSTKPPTSTPSNTPTRTPTLTPTNTPLNAATNTPTRTLTPTLTPSNTPTNTLTLSPTNTPLNAPTNTPTRTLTPTLTPSNTPTRTLTNTPTKTFTPTNTPTNTLTNPPGGFPSAPQLDTFTRANGAIGSSWSGYTTAFSILSNQLDVTSSGWNTYILWNSASYGANQEAYITFTQLDAASGNEHSLILKSQSSSSSSSGLVYVLYDHTNHVVQVWTYDPTQDWVQRGTNISVTFAPGDQFGARAKADGTVEVYKNGVLLGTRSITAWPFYASGGYIGLWFVNASAAQADNFGGGTVP